MTALPTTAQLPAALLEYDQWVCWQPEDRDGKPTKVPIDPSTGRYASSTDPETWTNFARARDHAVETASIAGLGFVFTDDDPFVGVDLDDCRSAEGETAPWATEIIDRLDSYTEISPSGTGFHVIVQGSLPGGPSRRGDVECYETARYFTVTGNSVHDPPRPISTRSTELAGVHADYVADDSTTDEANEGDDTDLDPDRTTPASTHDLDDETVIETALNATNGDTFERLWTGSTAGYDSHSEADMALCFHLAFWTGGDPAQIDRLFRRSDLMREKWDAVHYADGSTYGEKTVERAVDRVDEFYTPDSRSAQDPGGNSSPPPVTTDPADGRSDRNLAPGSRADDAVTAMHSDPRVLDVIDRLEARVDQLEAENDALRAELAEMRRQQADAEQGPRDGPDQSTDSDSNSDALWRRLLSPLGSTDD